MSDKTKDIILRVEDIHKSYSGVEVLRGISFTVRKGETKVFIGPSGTGKSTLLRCINQLTIPDSGQIWLHGEEVTHSKKVSTSTLENEDGLQISIFDHLTALRSGIAL